MLTSQETDKFFRDLAKLARARLRDIEQRGNNLETKNGPHAGDKVTCKIAEEAYYSRYAGNPVWRFEPGMIGVVHCIAPKVQRYTHDPPPGYDCRDIFAVVDYADPETGETRRVGLDFCNAKVVERCDSSAD